MATIRKTSSRTWEVQIRRRGYRARSATFDTRAEAARWAHEVEGDMSRGRFVDLAEAERSSLSEALDRYMNEITPRKKGWSSKETYIGKALKKHALAQRSLARVRSADVAQLIRDLEAKELGNQRIRLHLELLSHLFTVARTEWGMEGLSNPVQHITRPKPAAARERRLQGDEEARLIAACDPKVRSAVQFAIESAARQGEIAGLTWDRVDLGKRTVHFHETKTGEPRTVPISPAAHAVLTALPRRIDGSVFGMTTNAIQLAFRKARKRAGITSLHFHDLRHEATSRLFEKGLAIQEVAAITGHRDWRMLKRYTHPRAEDLARKLADLQTHEARS
ncbi:MAG TPA: site-specific integrase [Terriglobales bacterium]|nr:site-specific integrase [Terriglobales bacterium]